VKKKNGLTNNNFSKTFFKDPFLLDAGDHVLPESVAACSNVTSHQEFNLCNKMMKLDGVTNNKRKIRY